MVLNDKDFPLLRHVSVLQAHYKVRGVGLHRCSQTVTFRSQAAFEGRMSMSSAADDKDELIATLQSQLDFAWQASMAQVLPRSHICLPFGSSLLYVEVPLPINRRRQLCLFERLLK